MQSLCLIGALFGSLLAWPTSEYLGRKVSLILSGIPAAVGWLMIALAHLAAQSNVFYGVLLTGRLLTGIFYGWTSVCVPVSLFLNACICYIVSYIPCIVNREILINIFH